MKAPNPNEVADFLSAEAPEGSVQFEAPEEVKADLFPDPVQPDAVEQEQVRETLSMDPTFDPSNPSQQNTMWWTMELPALGLVEVTEAEKVLFLKAVLNDQPVTLDIKFSNTDLKATFRSRSVFEQKIIFQTLKMMANTEELGATATDADEYISYAQFFAVAIGLQEYNGKVMPRLTLSPEKTPLENSKALLEHAQKNIIPMNNVLWGVLLQAARIFEIKIKLCGENVHNETFWEPAS